MIPVLVVIEHSVVKEAVAYRSAEQLEAAFVAKNQEYGRETNSDEMDDGYVDLADATICMTWVGRPSTDDPREEATDYPVCDWRYEVSQDDTRLGYLDWVARKRECAVDRAADDIEPMVERYYVEWADGSQKGPYGIKEDAEWDADRSDGLVITVSVPVDEADEEEGDSNDSTTGLA